MDSYRILADGISVSNNTVRTGLNNNDIIIGSSGSGKTGGYVVPNIQNITGSVIVSETKRSLSSLFTNELIKKGYDVRILDFEDPSPSCGYDSLKAVKCFGEGKCREREITAIANALVSKPFPVDRSLADPAAGLLAFLIAYCLEALPEEDHNLAMVCDLFRKCFTENGIDPMTKWAEEHPDSYSAAKLGQILSLCREEKTWNSVLGFLNGSLEPLMFSKAGKMFSQPYFIYAMGERKTALFINVSDTDSSYANLVSLLYTQIFHFLFAMADRKGGGLRIPVRIIMDNFDAGAGIPDLHMLITAAASRNISVSLLLQSITQLESVYTHDQAASVINNCDHILYLGGHDMKTAEFISRRSFRSVGSVFCMPRDKAILISGGSESELADKIKPYSTLEGYDAMLLLEDADEDEDTEEYEPRPLPF